MSGLITALVGRRTGIDGRIGLLALLVFVGGCSGVDPDVSLPGPVAASAPPPAAEADSVEAGAEPPAPAADTTGGEAVADAPPPDLEPPETRPPPRPAHARALPWTEETLASLTLREKVGQMLMPVVLGDFAPEGSERHERVVRLIEEHGIGGVIVSVGSPAGVALKLNDLQEHSRLPLLVASDLENGPGFRFSGVVHLPGVVELGGATRFPPLMAVGATWDPKYAYEIGRVTAREARALGIHVPFAPVLDVNNNSQNPVINVRSFGEDPEIVSRMGVAFIQGVQEHGGLATGKHFPGHGDTNADSHVRVPVIHVSRERLESVELQPFRAGVAAGLGAVMTAHVAVPELTGSEEMPATLSRSVITDLLRRGMGFDGLVFTDAMDMGAVTRRYPEGEAVLRAVEAGADVILMPRSVEEAQRTLVEAVRSGRLPEARIDASARRILAAKERLGLNRGASVSLHALQRTVGVPEHEELAREIARRSLTLVRNRRDLLPLLGTRGAEVVSVTYRGPSDLLAGKYLDARLRRVYPGLRTVRLDRRTPEEEYEELERRTRRADLVVVSLHVNGVARDEEPVLPEELADFVDLLERRGTPHIAVSFGNPYLIEEFPDVQAYMLAWGGSRHSEEAVAGALFGEIETAGTLPVDLPPFFELGTGIRLRGGERRAGDR